MHTKKGLTIDSPADYQICIQGRLDASWADRLGGVTIRAQDAPADAPITVLTGSFQDQAALAGVLNTLYDLGLPLLSVECLAFPADKPARPPAMPSPRHTKRRATRLSESQI